MENTPVNKLRLLPQEFDPRSPTIDFNRTPIMIVDSPSSYGSSESQNVSFKSVLDESYDSFDMNLSRDDPSPIVSQLSLDIETSCVIDNECDNIIQDNQIDKSIIDTEPRLISIITEEPNEIVINKIESTTQNIPKEKIIPVAKKIIFSPNISKNSPNKNKNSPALNKNNKVKNSPSLIKNSPSKLLSNSPKMSSFTCHVDEENTTENNSPSQTKVQSPRTPLGLINKQSNSPLNILRAKQWKDFQEEREKRGILDSENVLPAFKVTPSSVPAKVPMRRRPLV